ncbi:ATP-dependent nuclease [Bacillus wiedmannii]|uniref:ATP-dependent nuclease n=1 Tax=Bacillus wiedmannii TaxID=1890302 RepID=UPI0021115298|nr:AAA family ATPase [Bacillus wiedmannii]MCQ6546257.1 AAA family ATPase [Bacillus wiedmannii]MCQ6574282.1 AAA family ATPase [Bacillus wiedmannii]
MTQQQSPFISKVNIKNFRNFKDETVQLSHKQIIIGENNVGKTNFLRALQIILDPQLSDDDRYLNETDFFDALDKPMESEEIIEIMIEMQGHEHNKNLLALFEDATVSKNPYTLRFTYKYFPNPTTKEYEYEILQGLTEKAIPFTHVHRKFLNLKVINAIRDVEHEMKNARRSPINNLLKQYEIPKAELEKISKNIKDKSDEILTIDEIQDLTKGINNKFSKIIGVQPDSSISLNTLDIHPSRILNTLKLMVGETNKRPTSETSLGLNNILYISLILLSLSDKTVPTYLKKEKYEQLLSEEQSEILTHCYTQNDKGNYFLNEYIEQQHMDLYDFLSTNNPSSDGFTILAIEEPEAHLHPALQRIIYKDVIQGNTSVLLTTHSPHITSVSPLNSIVHVQSTSQSGSKIYSTANLELLEKEQQDIERYLDVKRGELYFGKAVILVEGIAEEYLIPKFAELLGYPLDLKGIIVCNINSTDFTPYVKFLDQLSIPYVLITDGDFYRVAGTERTYHVLHEDTAEYGFLGHEIISDLLKETNKIEIDYTPEFTEDEVELFAQHGCFVGFYTMEVDIMDAIQMDEDENEDNIKEYEEAFGILCSTFNDLTTGGKQQKENFKQDLDAQDYWSCLRKIENSSNKVGKGRFAQRLSTVCTKKHIPAYIENAIKEIYTKVGSR